MLSVKELIEELQKHPSYMPVQITRNRVDIDDVRFEANHVELCVLNAQEFAPDDPDFYDFENLAKDALDILDDMTALVLTKAKDLTPKDKKKVEEARKFLAENL